MNAQNIYWGISPIGWRNDDMPEIGADNTLSHVLSDIVVARFQGTEIGGFFPDATLLKKEIALRNLKIAGQWFSSYLLRDGIEAVRDAFRNHCSNLQNVGANVVVVSEQTYSIQGTKQNIFADKPHFADKEWDRLCTGLDELAWLASLYDLKLVYHPHMGTGVQTIGEVDRLMAGTNPELVHLLYDSGHAYVSDQDYTTPIAKHIHRIKHVHFKDVRKNIMEECRRQGKSFLESFLSGMFTVPGDGCIDFTLPYQALLDSHYQGWIVVEAEQDPKKAHPLEYALKARNYIDEVLIKWKSL